MKLFGQTRVTVGFIIGVVFLLFTTLGTITIATQYQQTVADLRHYNNVQSTISDLFTELLNAETAQRGYVVTGNTTYLTPYYTALVLLPTINASMVALIAGNQNLSRQYSLLQPWIAQKLKELNETIFLRTTQGFAAAQAVVETNVGEYYMDQIRTIVGAMNAYAAQQESSDGNLATMQSSERIDVTYFNTVVALGVIGFAFYSIRRNLTSEEKARREAELLQDILTHDIRNYNQVTKLSAEFLRSKFKDDPESYEIVSGILQSVDGSTALVDRAKRLGKILSEEKVRLRPVNLLESVHRALDLVSDANRDLGKTIHDELHFADGSAKQPSVLADELLDEVFVNLFSNSVKYTDQNIVEIEIAIAEQEKFWKVSVSDKGKGISDDRKKEVFSRYMRSSSGSGLGLSIVYALVAERYGGEVRARDRVEGNYNQGTVIELMLRKAEDYTRE